MHVAISYVMQCLKAATQCRTEHMNCYSYGFKF